MSAEWKNFDNEKPIEGQKIIIRRSISNYAVMFNGYPFIKFPENLDMPKEMLEWKPLDI